MLLVNDKVPNIALTIDLHLNPALKAEGTDASQPAVLRDEFTRL